MLNLIGRIIMHAEDPEDLDDPGDWESDFDPEGEDSYPIEDV